MPEYAKVLIDSNSIGIRSTGSSSFRTSIRKYLNIILPLAFGVAIYQVFRGIPFIETRQIFHLQHSIIGSFILYNLPDGLWLYALLSAIKIIWETPSKELNYWLIFVVSGALLSEFAQRFHIIPGTFDWMDIAAYLMAAISFLIINNFSFIILKLKKQ